jgi:predicted DNA-binding transcriptional regulator YafY
MGMNKYDRLLYILNLLRSRRNLNAEMIARECGVTERSIYRDIIALSEANVPIYYDNGYKLASGNFLPPLNFDLNEYKCLTLALDSTPLAQAGQYRDTVKRIKAKVEAGLSETVRQTSKFSPRTTHIDIPVACDQGQVSRYFGRIEEAISKSMCVRLKYDSVESGTSERIVEPYFIIFRGRAFYFVAFCRLKTEFRTFRIDRIAALSLLDEHFDRRANVDADTYFLGSWQLYAGESVEVVVRLKGTAARVVLTTSHHPGEQIEKVSDREVIYRVVTRGIEEIQRWVLAFGSDAEVMAPEKLRENLAAIGEYYGTAYRSRS